MPEKRTMQRAKKDKSEGKAASTQAGEFVGKRWIIFVQASTVRRTASKPSPSDCRRLAARE